MLTFKPVIFDVCEIAAMHFKFISCDTDEWSFQNNLTFFMLSRFPAILLIKTID